MVDINLDHTYRQKQKGGLDPLMIINLLKKNWYLFLIGIALAFLMARFYISHTMPVYRSSITILINEGEDRPLVDNSALLEGLGLPGGMKNLHNQIMILRSRALTEMTLKSLPFEVEYYVKTLRNRLPIYPDSPIRIITDVGTPLPKDIEFIISYLGNNMFTIKTELEYLSFPERISFGDPIDTPGGSFRIECRDEEWFKSQEDQTLCFVIHSRTGLMNYYSNRINVELVSRDGSLVKISLTGTNKSKDVEFLNRHVERFQSISLEKKNTEADRRIQFIDDQLIGISDSLSTTENKLQQFRSSHRVMDLSAQGQALIGQVTLLENERARLNLEANYYDYLAEYLSKDVSSEMPIVPITMGISDPGLTRLVGELAELQSQLSARGAGEMNPLQRNLEQRVRSAKEALRETLNGLRRANSLARSENQEQINKANSQASALPITERQLLGIERKFTLNNELYTFLLETRAEQQMQKASNRADSEVIDPADERFSLLVSPDPIKVYFLALLGGAGIPLLLVLLGFIFNKKLKDEDIRGMANLPIAGYIPHSRDEKITVVYDYPSSTISEAFRLLRSRMQFFTKDARSSVVLVTSSMPGEGKSFISVNVAAVYSLLGKRTVLVGFDLRKPKIYGDFNIQNKTGVSTWLIGESTLQDIIQKTSYDNFSIISSGPIPPNPSELTALDKTKELVRLLKEKYEIIIIDSPPIGIVSDSFYLAPMADVCLLVVRSEHTLRDMFEKTLNEITESGTKGVSLVVNDIQSNSKYYSYGEKYGYTKEKKRRRKTIL